MAYQVMPLPLQTLNHQFINMVSPHPTAFHMPVTLSYCPNTLPTFNLGFSMAQHLVATKQQAYCHGMMDGKHIYAVTWYQSNEVCQHMSGMSTRPPLVGFQTQVVSKELAGVLWGI